MKYIKENSKFFLFVVIIGIISSVLITYYSISMLSPEMMEVAIKQVGSREMVIIITIIENAIFSIIYAFFGIILSNKAGLWKNIKIEKKALIITLMIGVLGGLTLLFADKLIFANFNGIIKESYNIKPDIITILASITYGGVIEEVMLRLFIMSLIVYIIKRSFYNEKEVPVMVFVIANIISALLFAAGHLPSTYTAFGGLDAVLIIRCFVLNGGFGLAFGWLYRKYGIHYSMMAHAFCHIVSKCIWLLL